MFQPAARSYLAVIVALLLLGATDANGATYVVRADGSGDFPTIQEAINAVENGDVVELTDGTYTGEGNRDVEFLGKPVTLCSQSGNAAACIIDCDGSETDPHRGFHLRDHEEPETVIRDLTVMRGWDADQGGAVWLQAASPTIIGCVFNSCYAYYGGGIYLGDGASPHVIECHITENLGGFGAGIFLLASASPVFEGCTIRSNEVLYEGGGVACRESATPEFRDCLFEQNAAPYRAGAIIIDDYCDPVAVTGCTFLTNASARGGAAVCCGVATGTFKNCTFRSNIGSTDGAAFYISCSGTAVVENCIIAASTSGEAIFCNSAGSAEVACTDIYGNAGGDWVQCIADQLGINGNFSADPVFCDAVAGDCTLHHSSPCLPGRHPDGVPCGLIGAEPIGCPATGVEVPIAPREAIHLSIAGPNPFRDAVRIAYDLSGSNGRPIDVAIYDPAGRCVRSLVRGERDPGPHQIVWDGTDEGGAVLPSGVYFCRFRAGGAERIRPVHRIR